MFQKSKWEETYNQMRPYQKESITFMWRRARALNYDDMGLGKTVSTLLAVSYHYIEQPFRLLILCPNNAVGVWQLELEKWFDVASTIYRGTPAKRKKINVSEKFQVVITTYGMLKELEEYYWDAVIADEIHTPAAGLLNHKNKSFVKFEKFARNLKRVILLTGTPIRQGVIDMYAPLNIVAASVFRNYWSFVNRYCITIETPYGKSIERRPRNPEQFRILLNSYRVRHIKSEELEDLPGKQRNPIPITMTKMQAKIYQQLEDELMFISQDDTILAPNQLTGILKLRQLLVSPRLLGIDDDGAALTHLREVIPDYILAERPLVIFTPFKEALVYLNEIIKELALGIKVFTLSGGLSSADFATAWQGFQKHNGAKVLLCTIQSGASFQATCAADCFFLGFEWDFNQNAQAEDRLCRMGQKNFVNCNYLLHEDTVDVKVKERLNDKNLAADIIIGTDKQYIKLLKELRRR